LKSAEFRGADWPALIDEIPDSPPSHPFTEQGIRIRDGERAARERVRSHSRRSVNLRAMGARVEELKAA